MQTVTDIYAINTRSLCRKRGAISLTAYTDCAIST